MRDGEQVINIIPGKQVTVITNKGRYTANSIIITPGMIFSKTTSLRLLTRLILSVRQLLRLYQRYMLKEVFLNSRIRYFTALTLQRPHGFIAGAKRKPSETRLHQVRYLNLFTLMIYLDTKCLRQVSEKRNGCVFYQPNHYRTRCEISVLHVYNLIICISLVCYAEGPN